MEQKTFDAILVRFSREQFAEHEILEALNQYCEDRNIKNKSNIIRLALHRFLEKQKYLPLKQKNEKPKAQTDQS